MLGVGLIVALPFALLLILPPRFAAWFGLALSVSVAFVGGYFVGTVLGFGSGVVAAGFFGFCGMALTGLFALLRMEARGEVRQATRLL